jgi:hypothetical protein
LWGEVQAEYSMRRVLLFLVPAVAPAVWSTPQKLAQWSGSEPSIAIDPNDANAVYVSAPQS